nr:hypothetical protein [Bacilli bacterium]
MKETRNIMFVTLACSILLGILYEFEFIKNSELLFSLVTNLWCGFIVSFITSSCQFYSQRSKIVNDIYKNYFDFYRTYYFAIRNKTFGHVNFKAVQNKFAEIGGKNSDLVGEYCGIFRKNDCTYKKIDPDANFTWTCKEYSKNYLIFNAKAFEETYGALINDVKMILKGINAKRFKDDCEYIEKFYNKFMSKK